MLISLIGLPGVGKSTIGRRLARRLGLDFIDCDSILERRLGESIRAVFEAGGEQRFRDEEAELLVEMTAGDDAVIATGGGVVLRPANRELLRSRTLCVYLKARPEDLLYRLHHDAKRPLLQVADPEQRLRELSAEREPLYQDAATIVLETRGMTFDRLFRAVTSQMAAADSRGVTGKP